MSKTSDERAGKKASEVQTAGLGVSMWNKEAGMDWGTGLARSSISDQGSSHRKVHETVGEMSQKDLGRRGAKVPGVVAR